MHCHLANPGKCHYFSVEVILPSVPLRAGQTFWCLRDADAFQDFTGIDVGDEGVNWIEDHGHTDGSGEPWEYKEAWARRRDNVRAASARFELGEGEVAETNCSDDAESNESSECPYRCGPGRYAWPSRLCVCAC